MKNFLILLYMGVIAGLAYIFPGKDVSNADADKESTPSVLSANAATPTKRVSISTTATDPVSDDIRAFIINAAEGRMMDFAQGKAAEQQSNTTDVKKYAGRMMDDQSKMLKALRALANKKGIDLPKDVGSKNTEALAELREKKGDAFDKKFIKMMVTDHKREVREFKNAIDLDDADVKAFATHYLPVVEGHLQEIKEIRSAM